MAILNDLKLVGGVWVDQGTNDLVTGTAEDDTVNLYSGNDLFLDEAGGNDYIFDVGPQYGQGFSGNDTIFAGTGNDVVVSSLDVSPTQREGYYQAYNGGEGFDTLSFVPSAAGVTVDLVESYAWNSAGQNTLIAGFESVFGSQFKDFLLGDGTANQFYGWAGDDVIDGRGGDDFINGGYGNDWINGGDGDDTLYGGDTDPFYNDDDTIYGGNGADLIFGGLGHDQIYGESGGDRMYGGLGNDRMNGGGDNDEVVGDRGNDQMSGGSGGDFVSGGEGNDLLFGETGRDTLLGGLGDDLVVGGIGADSLFGGAGLDQFRFNSLLDSSTAIAAADVIGDFRKGADRIDVSAIDAKAALPGNQAFAFIGDHAFTAAGQISASYHAGTNETIVRLNTDGDAAAEMLIRLTGHINLSAQDFIL